MRRGLPSGDASASRAKPALGVVRERREVPSDARHERVVVGREVRVEGALERVGLVGVARREIVSAAPVLAEAGPAGAERLAVREPLGFPSALEPFQEPTEGQIDQIRAPNLARGISMI